MNCCWCFLLTKGIAYKCIFAPCVPWPGSRPLQNDGRRVNGSMIRNWQGVYKIKGYGFLQNLWKLTLIHTPPGMLQSNVFGGENQLEHHCAIKFTFAWELVLYHFVLKCVGCTVYHIQTGEHKTMIPLKLFHMSMFFRKKQIKISDSKYGC